MLVRDPESAARTNYDVIVVGAGIYGSMLALEASGMGQKVLLLDRGDFGGQTSFNSLRILHGGLRYLQNIDLKRFFESVLERRWYLRVFPDLVHPMPCLMPLRAKGLRRNSIFHIALLVNDLMSATRNCDVSLSHALPRGEVLSADETARCFPQVDRNGLTGGARWYDAATEYSQRIIVEILHWAVLRGAAVLNYVEATKLIVKDNVIYGLRGRDTLSDTELEFHAPVVVNATGPWVEETARIFDTEIPGLFRPSLAWNILVDQETPSECCVALVPPRAGAPTYFMRPWKKLCLIGTGHAKWTGDSNDVSPTPEQISAMIRDVDAAAPQLDISRATLLHVFAGLLPAKPGKELRLLDRPALVDHRLQRGPTGLFSVSGVKFTTARRVAISALRIIARAKLITPRGASFHYDDRPEPQSDWEFRKSDKPTPANVARLNAVAIRESVQHIEDLVFRRTNLWEHPGTAYSFATSFCDSFYSNETERKQKVKQLKAQLHPTGSLNTSEKFLH